jgi:hypothetical protein
MKKFLFILADLTTFLLLAVALFFALPAFSQQVDSSQMKLKTNGGLAGDTASALAVGVYRGTSAPASPVTGQLWCDTNTNPCILKTYSGSSWVAPASNATIPVQTDVSTFPDEPTDGQLFFSKSPPGIYVYNADDSRWHYAPFTMTAASTSIIDVYTDTTITPPAAPTATESATAGSLSAGNYSYKITCRNSTGGETTGGTVSATVAPGASKSTDLSDIPLCGTGGVARGIYRSKVNQQTTGPWYWVATISDNSTTTANDGVADASLVLMSPDINFSGALPTGWTVANDTTATTSGGCGVTARGTMVCMTSNALTNKGCLTDDLWLKAIRDITTYESGNYTITFRMKQISQDGDTYPSIMNPGLFGMRNGTQTNAIRFVIGAGVSSVGTSCATGSYGITMPYTSTNHGFLYASVRTSVGGNSNGSNYMNNAWPSIDGFPFWFKIAKRGNYIRVYSAYDLTAGWTPISACGTSNDNSSCAFWGGTFGPTTSQFELMATPTFQNSTTYTQMWIEIDSWSLTVE